MAVGETAQPSPATTLTYEGSRLTEYSNRTEKSARVLDRRRPRSTSRRSPNIRLPAERSAFAVGPLDLDFDDIALSVVSFPVDDGLPPATRS